MAKPIASRTTNPVNPVKNPDDLDQKVKRLATLLANQIERSSELLEEIRKLEESLLNMKKQRDGWRKLYKRIKPDEKFPCDRQRAMVEYGDVDMSEVLGSK